MTLTRQVHSVLVEATRRRSRFFSCDPVGGKGICSQWTGLGTMAVYREAQARGYMEIATSESEPRCATWWRLTPKGAVIVAYWLGKGFDFQAIESDNVPPQDIPEILTA